MYPPHNNTNIITAVYQGESSNANNSHVYISLIFASPNHDKRINRIFMPTKATKNNTSPTNIQPNIQPKIVRKLIRFPMYL